MRPGIVICTRSDSTRIPRKPFQLIKDRPLIFRLLDQLKDLGIPICIAAPVKDALLYTNEFKDKDVLLYFGEDDSPLHRTEGAAWQNIFSHIIRITHDKIFIDTESLKDCLNLFYQQDFNYIFSSHIIEGSGFEIFTYDVLSKACVMFQNQNVEHISYAIKSVVPRMLNYSPNTNIKAFYPEARFLIDFEEDLEFIKSVYSYSLSGNPDLKEALETIERFPFLKKINKQPDITVYTCAYNEERFIQWCMESISSQTIFQNIEYIIIDDASTDNTYKKILSSKLFANKKIKVKRNEKNIGLSSSSNLALNLARGKYILRLDADDALLFPFTLEKMLKKAKEENYDAMYPTYVDDKTKRYVLGQDNHHVGGCLFLTKTIRNIQFTEHLRGWEGLDLFERAKDQINIGYYDDMPAFFYRDKPNSMSKTDPEYRESIRKLIADGKLGNDLIVGAPI